MKWYKAAEPCVIDSKFYPPGYYRWKDSDPKPLDAVEVDKPPPAPKVETSAPVSEFEIVDGYPMRKRRA